MFRELIIVLAMLSGLQSLANAERQAPPSAVLGDVRVTVVEVRKASDAEIEQYRIHLRYGYHAVLVTVKFKNVARYPSCFYVDEWLLVKQGYEYPRYFNYSGGLSSPRSDLPPTEESSGVFAFEVKDGLEPAFLKLIRNVLGENLCAQFQHRERGILGLERVNLSLQGVPSNTGHRVNTENRALGQEPMGVPPHEKQPEGPSLPQPGEHATNPEVIPTIEKPDPTVIAPKPLYAPDAEYTDEARQANLSGIVSLRVLVGNDGLVRDAVVLRGLGMGLDEQAIASVRQWKFTPATRNDQPVESWVKLDFEFRQH